MSNTIDTTSTIKFNNEGKPEVYTNVENKLLCKEMAENLLLNCVQIDWQDVHLSNIGRITELSDFVDDPNNFNINTTEELLWVIDQLVAKAYISLGTITLSFNSSSHEYSGTVWKPTATVSATGSSVTPVSGTHYTLTWSNSSSTNVGTYSCTVTLTETGKRYFSNTTVTKNYTITTRGVTVKLSNPTQNVNSSSEIDTTITSTGLVNGHTLSNVTVDISQSPNDSNVYILTPNVQNAIIKKSSTDVTSNYNISVETGTATVQSQASNYLYIGTTKPTSLSDAQPVNSYQAEQTYTNNSGAKSHIFVLTNSDKNVVFEDPNTHGIVTQKPVDTSTVSGYNIFETSVGCANTGSIIIKIS